WPIKNIITRGAAALSPFRTRRRPCVADTIDISGRVIGADLLTVAINAPVCRINPTAARGHARFRRRINVRALFVHLWVEGSDLQVGNNVQANQRDGERPKTSQKKGDQSFHNSASNPTPPIE